MEPKPSDGLSTRWIVPINRHETDGNPYYLSFGFYDALSMIWRGKNSGHIPHSSKSPSFSFCIPDCVCFSDKKLSWFFYSKKQKRILKKNTANVTIANIVKAFTSEKKSKRKKKNKPSKMFKNTRTSLQNIPDSVQGDNIVAFLVEVRKKHPDGETMTRLRYLTKEQLVHHLRYFNQNEESPNDFLLVKYVRNSRGSTFSNPSYVRRRSSTSHSTKRSANVGNAGQPKFLPYFEKLYYSKWTPRHGRKDVKGVFIEGKIIPSSELYCPKISYEPIPAHVKSQIRKINSSIIQQIEYLTDDLLKPTSINFVAKEDIYGRVHLLFFTNITTICTESKAPVKTICYKMKIEEFPSYQQHQNRPSLSRQGNDPGLPSDFSSAFSKKYSFVGRKNSLLSRQSNSRGRSRNVETDPRDLEPPKWTCPGCFSSKTSFKERDFIPFSLIVAKFETEENQIDIPPVIQSCDPLLSKFRYENLRRSPDFLNRLAPLCSSSGPKGGGCAQIYHQFKQRIELLKSKLKKTRDREEALRNENEITLELSSSSYPPLSKEPPQKEIEKKKKKKKPESPSSRVFKFSRLRNFHSYGEYPKQDPEKTKLERNKPREASRDYKKAGESPLQLIRCHTSAGYERKRSMRSRVGAKGRRNTKLNIVKFDQNSDLDSLDFENDTQIPEEEHEEISNRNGDVEDVIQPKRRRKRPKTMPAASRRRKKKKKKKSEQSHFSYRKRQTSKIKNLSYRNSNNWEKSKACGVTRNRKINLFRNTEICSSGFENTRKHRGSTSKSKKKRFEIFGGGLVLRANENMQTERVIRMVEREKTEKNNVKWVNV